MAKKKSGRKIKNPEDKLDIRFESPKGEKGEDYWPLGWYIFVRQHTTHFRAILVRFGRRQDAEMARKCLMAADLITFKRLRDEPPLNVLRIMCENLQW